MAEELILLDKFNYLLNQLLLFTGMSHSIIDIVWYNLKRKTSLTA